MSNIVFYYILIRLPASTTILTPGCFNIQTRDKFDNFCLFSSIALTLIKIKWDIFSISTVFTIIHIIWITSFRQSYRQKVHKYNIFGRQDIIQFLSGVAKYHKYVIYKIKINLPVCWSFIGILSCHLSETNESHDMCARFAGEYST